MEHPIISSSFHFSDLQYVVIHDDKGYEVLRQQIGTSEVLPEIQISKNFPSEHFPSLQALFNSVHTIFPYETRELIESENYIEKVFFNGLLPPAESLELLKSCLLSDNYKLRLVTQEQSDNVLQDIQNQLASVAQSASHSPPKTYEDWLIACCHFDIHVHSRKRFIFTSELALYFWVFEQVIINKITIRNCMCCGRYFASSDARTKYCSPTCSEKAQYKSRFCGSHKVEKQYHSVYQALVRKIKSNQRYRYNPPNFPKSFQEYALFRGCPVSPKNLKLSYIFTKDDFLIIQKAFLSENEKYYKDFRTAASLFRTRKISFDKFQQAEDVYSNWLSNVRILIYSFEY